jgi:hypothetical protein
MKMQNNILGVFFKEFMGFNKLQGAWELGHMPPLLLANNFS